MFYSTKEAHISKTRLEQQDCTACGHRMAYRKWKETKLEPSLLPGPAVLGSSLVSFHFLWAILCPRPQAVVERIARALSEGKRERRGGASMFLPPKRTSEPSSAAATVFPRESAKAHRIRTLGGRSTREEKTEPPTKNRLLHTISCFVTRRDVNMI